MPAAHILMTTTVGPMTLELDADNAPKTVENFLSYVSSGFYDCLLYTSPSPRDRQKSRMPSSA